MINHAHDDGRQCIVGSDGKTWRYWEAPYDQVGGIICFRPHPAKEEREHVADTDKGDDAIHIDVTDTIKRMGVSGREFGHPGVGSAIRGMLNIPLPKMDAGPFSPLSVGRGGPMGQHTHARLFGGTHDQPGAMDFRAGPGKMWSIPEREMKCTITRDRVDVDYGENGHGAEAVTNEARYILGQLPEIIIKFLESNAKYARAQTGHDLGAEGVIPDINRKTAALISRVWDGEDAGRDSDEELVDDLIGHLLLIRAKLAAENGDGS